MATCTPRLGLIIDESWYINKYLLWGNTLLTYGTDSKPGDYALISSGPSPIALEVLEVFGQYSSFQQ